jgi:four helix bundle protein
MGSGQQAVGSGVGKIESYRDLRVWQEAMTVAENVHRVSTHAPPNWKHALANQTLRAAASVTANIAEGYGRESTGSYLQFLKIARGSQKELETHVLLALRVGAFRVEQAGPILAGLEGVGKMLNALIRSIQSSRNAAPSQHA